jgi:tyrosine-protein kinase Etk/Wzc
MADEVNLLEYWLIIWKRRWIIGGLCVGAVIVTLLLSLRMPPVYESAATILPPAEGKDGGGLAAALAATGAAGALGGFIPGIPANNADLFVALLKSRIMADEILKRFDLLNRYHAKLMTDARKALEGRTKITVAKEKVIKVTVEDEDPKLAADIANFYVGNLDSLNHTLNISKASQNRAFIEKRLVETKVELAKAEDALKEFQTQKKAVSLEAQGKAAIEAAAMIQGQISATEVQLKVTESYLAYDNPELARLRSNLQELRNQLYLLESGKGGRGQLPGDRMHPAFISVPTLALDYGRLLREVKVQETLYTLLTSHYEQAKIAEAKDTPTVQVLDPAIPAERRSKPSIRLNMMIAGLVGVFVGIFLAFVFEYLARVKSMVSRRVAPDLAGPPAN